MQTVIANQQALKQLFSCGMMTIAFVVIALGSCIERNKEANKTPVLKCELPSTANQAPA